MMRRLCQSFQRPSLLRRLSLVLLGAVLVTTSAGVAGILVFVFKGKTGEWDRGNERFAMSLLLAIEGDLRPEWVTRAAIRVRDMQIQEYGTCGVLDAEQSVAYQVIVNHGIVYRSSNSPDLPLGTGVTGIHEEWIRGEHWWVTTSVSSDGVAQVHVGSPSRARWNQAWQGTKAIFPFILLFYVSTCVIFVIAARRGLAPLFHLASLVKARAQGDISPVTPEVSYEETQPLVDALNGLLEQARRSLDIQRRFIADAAHELRTPLAVVGAQAHVLANAENTTDRSHANRSLHEGLDRATELIQQLLTVARLEESAIPNMEPLELEALLRKIAVDTAPGLLEAGCDMGFISEGPVWVQGDADGIRSAVENLLHNVRKYAGEGTQVDLRLWAEAESVVVEVLDDGSGVPEHHLGHLSERFFRVPGTTATGSGLGLAIVRHVVEAHGGTLQFGKGLDGKGFGVCIRLPRLRGNKAPE